MKSCLLTAVDQALHRHKHTTAHDRLPLELWYLIWQQLPIPDRIVFTRVCKDWRTSLSSSTVWQHIDISGLLYRYPDWRKLLSKLLARSEPLPLYLRLEHRDPSQSYGLSFDLFELVQPHLHRVVQLRLKAQQYGFVKGFFGHFDALPALRSLVVEDAATGPKLPWLVTPLRLPVLEYIDIYRGYQWVQILTAKRDGSILTFPSVTCLRVGVQLVERLEEALEACPRLTTLDVYVVDDEFGSEDRLMNEPARRVIAQLDTMHVHLATSSFVDWLARALALDGVSLRKLTVDVRDSQAKKSSFSFSFLTGMDGPRHITCLHRDGRLSVTARDAAERRIHCITFTMDACERIISQLAAALTDSCDVLELDPVISKLADAVPWAVKVHTPDVVESAYIPRGQAAKYKAPRGGPTPRTYKCTS